MSNKDLMERVEILKDERLRITDQFEDGLLLKSIYNMSMLSISAEIDELLIIISTNKGANSVN